MLEQRKKKIEQFSLLSEGFGILPLRLGRHLLLVFSVAEFHYTLFVGIVCGDYFQRFEPLQPQVWDKIWDSVWHGVWDKLQEEVRH